MTDTARALKEKIHSGAPTIGLTAPIDVSRARLESAVARHGPYDFMYVDSQHSAFSEPALVAFCRLAEELALPVRLRLKHTRHTYLIGNLLDLGPVGIEVPQVESLDTAREAVDNVYYPPMGRRSYGGGQRHRVAAYDSPPAYCSWWNGSGILWLQLESMAAVLQAHRWALPGVDCFSFGPTDLSIDIEQHPHPPYRSVEACVQATARSMEGTGVRLSFRNHVPEQRQHWADLGVSVFLERPEL